MVFRSFSFLEKKKKQLFRHFGHAVFILGDKNNQVHFEGYQVSNQCAALVRDECLLPTLDAPELAYVPESSEKHYVPDVYFKVCVQIFPSKFIL